MTTLSETAALPVILPLSEAARKSGTDESTLRAMVQSGKIRAFIDPEGIMYVQMTQDGTLPLAVADDAQQPPADDINARLSQIRREDFAHLEGQAITVSEAAKKYRVPVSTIHTWIHRGYLTTLGKAGRRRQIDEADIAFCAAIYHVRKPFGSRAPLLSEDGRPYLLKAPELARLRRQVNQN